MEDLEKILQGLQLDEGRLIVVDGVFSMEGDTANLPEIVRLARRYGARIYVDEAHAIGVLGNSGRGAAEHYGVESDVDIVMGTFSKSFASIAPANAAAVLKAVEIIEREPERRQQLKHISTLLRRELVGLGFRLLDGITPVIPVVVDDEALVCKFFWELMNEGIYTNPVLAPAVSHSLVRISCMATHTDEHAGRLLEAMHRIGKGLELIS
jgi:7-keto-8-aminopelargonate synthetase-like enzyme